VNASHIGRTLIVLGVVVVVVGAVLVAAGRLGLGRLPGDFSFSRGNSRVFVPLGTSVVISIVLTILVNLFFRR